MMGGKIIFIIGWVVPFLLISIIIKKYLDSRGYFKYFVIIYPLIISIFLLFDYHYEGGRYFENQLVAAFGCPLIFYLYYFLRK